MTASAVRRHDLGDLRAYLVDSRLAGPVATPPRSTLDNCARLVAGHEEYTFGLSDHRDATIIEAVEAVRLVCGGDPGGADADGSGWINPDATLAAIERHREVLAGAAREQIRVLLATGHPTGLLAHYGAVARALQASGCTILAPLDDTFVPDAGLPGPVPVGIRYLDGVACAHDGGRLLHTHRASLMEAMLDELGGGSGAVDLVIADHGMAGAAVERGITTLSIADVNDPALMLAQSRGRTHAVLPVDDNLAPRCFLPVTAAMLEWNGDVAPRRRGGRS